MTSASKWDSEEGGDEDVEQEEELGEKLQLLLNNHIITKKLGLLTKVRKQ